MNRMCTGEKEKGSGENGRGQIHMERPARQGGVLILRWLQEQMGGGGRVGWRPGREVQASICVHWYHQRTGGAGSHETG